MVEFKAVINDTKAGKSYNRAISGNLASLGQALGRVDSESIAVHDTGAVVTQSLVYQLK